MKKQNVSIGIKFLYSSILAMVMCFSSVVFADSLSILHEDVKTEQDDVYLQETVSAIVMEGGVPSPSKSTSVSLPGNVKMVVPPGQYDSKAEGQYVSGVTFQHNGTTISNPVFTVKTETGETQLTSSVSVYYTFQDGGWLGLAPDTGKYVIRISERVEAGDLYIRGYDASGKPIEIKLGTLGGNIKVNEQTTVQSEPGFLRSVWNWITQPFEEAARMVEEILVELLLRVGDGILYMITASVGETVTIDRLVFNGVGKVNVNYWEGVTAGSKDVKATMAKVVVPWYQVFYKLAVIVYIVILIVVGIQVLLNSTAEKKAKYKEVLVSWFVGVAMLTLFPYVLKYVVTLNETAVAMMCTYLNKGPLEPRHVPEIIDSKTVTEAMASFGTIEFVDYMMKEDLIVNSVIELENVTDSMLQVRLQAQFKAKIVLVIIYFILMGQMIVLLFMYYKRAFMLAFLITIFPLVAMTYVVDKIGDKKAQSFEIWFKEYIVNVVVQLFHAIVYVVIVSASVKAYMTDKGASWLFMILSVLFLFQGEKILRNIFGIKSSANTVADLAATGAALYGVRKIFGGGGKDKNIGSAQDNADANVVASRMQQRPDVGAQSAEAREAAARNAAASGGGSGGTPPPESPAGSYTGNDPAGVDTAGYNATAAQDTVIQKAMSRKLGRGFASGAVNFAGKFVGATAGATYGMSKGDTASGSAIGEAIQGGAAGGMIGATVVKPAEAIVNKAEQVAHGRNLAKQIDEGEMDGNLGLNVPPGMAMPGNIDPNEIVGKHGETMQEIYRKALAEMARTTATKGKARGEMAYWNYIEENMDSGS